MPRPPAPDSETVAEALRREQGPLARDHAGVVPVLLAFALAGLVLLLLDAARPA